jgi:hypothetical protein
MEESATVYEERWTDRYGGGDKKMELEWANASGGGDGPVVTVEDVSENKKIACDLT